MKFTTFFPHIMFLNNMGAQGIRHVINIMGYVRDIPDRAYFTSCQLCIVISTRLSFGLHILQTQIMYKWSILRQMFCVFVLKYESEMWWKCWLCTGQLKSQVLSNGQCSKTDHFLTIVQLFMDGAYVSPCIRYDRTDMTLSVNSHLDSKKLKPMKKGERCYEDSLFAMQ